MLIKNDDERIYGDSYDVMPFITFLVMNGTDIVAGRVFKSKKNQYFCTVKLLTLLLSFIVLTLTSVPCCALENSEAGHSIQESAQNEDDCGQTCSPFYTCGSCVGFMTTQYPGELFAFFLRAIQHNSIYPSFELPQSAASIWQPPQLS